MKNRNSIKCVFFLLLVSLIVGCSLGYNEVFKATDELVESLYTKYESYGIGSAAHTKTAKDGYFSIIPMGRLIIVRIEKIVDDKEYDKLQKALERHYKNDKRVNKVYINQGGTVVVDCRMSN